MALHCRSTFLQWKQLDWKVQFRKLKSSWDKQTLKKNGIGGVDEYEGGIRDGIDDYEWISVCAKKYSLAFSIDSNLAEERQLDLSKADSINFSAYKYDLPSSKLKDDV